MIADYRPRYCVWELTLACDLRCGHCGSSAGRPRPGELRRDEALGVVSQLADLGCKMITLSGGEPTLSPHWEAVARAARARGMVVNMVTNGMSLDHTMAGRMRDAGLANVALSLEGPAEVHESIRGAGTFRRVLGALDHLARAGLPSATMTHLVRHTAATLEQTLQISTDHGARLWRAQLGKPMGRLARERERLLRPADLAQLLPQVARLRQQAAIQVTVGDSLGFLGSVERQLGRLGWNGAPAVWAGCQAGRRAIGIESDGGVKGCLSLQSGRSPGRARDPFREGDLRSQLLEQLWFAPQAFAYNRGAATERLSGFCRSCAHSTRCRGGATCVAAAFTGAVGDNPYCLHRVEQQLLRRRARRGRLRQQAAAAVLALGLASGLGGCGSRSVSPNDGGALADGSPTSDARAADGRATADTLPPADALAPKPDAAPCKNVCCECDYGLPPPPECCGY